MDSIVIRAAREQVVEATLDFGSYPVWARSVRRAVVKETDSVGRGSVVGYEVRALRRTLRYTLRYDYRQLPASYSWTQVEGDPRSVDGWYRFDDTEAGITRVTYSLAVDLGIPLPRFILRRAERIVLTNALKELKAYVET